MSGKETTTTSLITTSDACALAVASGAAWAIVRWLTGSGDPSVTDHVLAWLMSAIVGVVAISLSRWLQSRAGRADEGSGFAALDGLGRSTFEESAIAVGVAAPDGKFLRINHAMCALTGYSEQELLAIDFQRITHPDDLNVGVEPRKKVLAGEVHSCQIDKRYIRKDGRTIWVTMTLWAVRDAQNKPVGTVAHIQDITARKRAEDNLAASERIARSTVDALTARVAILDENGEITSVNKAWRRFAIESGNAATNCGLGTGFLDFCTGGVPSESADIKALADGVRMVTSGERQSIDCEYRCPQSDDSKWFLARITRFQNDNGVRIVVAHEDVTDRKQMEERLRHESLHDKLTGLPNRSLFADRVERAIERSKRKPAFKYAVLFVDLDRFKIINDSLGHAAGDQLLLLVSDVLKRCTRSSDSVSRINDNQTVARLGGDEFTVLLEDLRDPSDAAMIAERILAELGHTITYQGHEIQSTASIGIVVGGPQYHTAHDLLRDADAAMYKAKAAGKARYAIFDASMHRAALKRLHLEADLRHALDRNELELHYQPIVSLQTREVVCVEALLRWKHHGAYVDTGELIAIAEDSGLIVPIGRWALRHACEQLVEWQRAHPALRELSMSVNLSRRQLLDPSLLTDLKTAMFETGILPKHLHLEITESLVMSDLRTSAGVCEKIREMGVALYMDDFGTGYSSMSCLHQFPLTGIKIDKAFIRNLTERRDYTAVIQAMLTLARNLNIQVVAEGLETADQVTLLQSLDCDYGQGYYFSKAIPADKAFQHLLSNYPLRQSA